MKQNKTISGLKDKIPGFLKMDAASAGFIVSAIIDGPMPVMLLNADGRIEYVNRKFTDLTGYEMAELKGKDVSVLTCAECCHNTIVSVWQDILLGESWSGESEGCRKDGGRFWEQTSVTPILNEKGEISHYLKISYDISHRKKLERELCAAIAILKEKEQNLLETCNKLKQTTCELEKSKAKLQYLSQEDSLTGLLNRRGFQRELRKLKAVAEREDKSIGIIIIDIDHFKIINDNYGHAVGDYVLRKFAAILKSMLRVSDLICRYGGDEVVIAMPVNDCDAVAKTADRILIDIRNTNFSTGQTRMPVTLSIGAACEKPIRTRPLHNLIKKADRALYQSKRNGRNTITLWHKDDSLDSEDGEIHPSALNRQTQKFNYVFNTLVEMLDAREKATGEHSRRVSKMVGILARTMALSDAQIEMCEQGALLHDIGKIIIPDSILLKPGELSAEEWEIVKKHPQTGYDILKSNPEFREIAEIVLSHQERFDGTGYPRKLPGEQICLGARINAIADSYDAIRVGRLYSSPRSYEEARAEIERCSGTQFDPLVVATFLRCQHQLETVFPSQRSD